MGKNFIYTACALALLFFVSCSEDSLETIIDNTNKTEMSYKYSNTISLDEARVELEKLLCDVYQSQSSRSIESSINEKVIANAFTIRDEVFSTRSYDIKSLIIHVFNFEDKEGFALMSGNADIPIFRYA